MEDKVFELCAGGEEVTESQSIRDSIPITSQKSSLIAVGKCMTSETSDTVKTFLLSRECVGRGTRARTVIDVSTAIVDGHGI